MMDCSDAFETMMSPFHFSNTWFKPHAPSSRTNGYRSSVLDLTVCSVPPPKLSHLSDLKGFLSVEDLNLQLFPTEDLYSKVLSFLSFILFEYSTSYTHLAFEDIE
jgi:hypothetical protein